MCMCIYVCVGAGGWNREIGVHLIQSVGMGVICSYRVWNPFGAKQLLLSLVGLLLGGVQDHPIVCV